MVEFWRAGGSEITTSAATARGVENEGWDGQMFMDSQSLSCDPWVMMGAWAMATDNLRLCTGVTNSLTRHPAVTAACAASVQAISGGRAVLGIGRGDSALAYLGYAPDKLSHFRATLENLQQLLAGEAVAFSRGRDLEGASSADSLALGGRPAATTLKWLDGSQPKVPLDVAATGPRVIEMGAALAERVTFSVGAIPERVQWALDTAREARNKSAAATDCSYGVQIIVVCHPDLDAVMEAATSFVAPLARFQVIQGSPAGPQSDEDSRNFSSLYSYDMNKHGKPIDKEKLKDATLTPDFVRRFAIVGSPDYCTERLLKLIDMGIERFVIVGPGYHPEFNSRGPGLFVSEVMPAVRQAL